MSSASPSRREVLLAATLAGTGVAFRHAGAAAAEISRFEGAELQAAQVPAGAPPAPADVRWLEAAPAAGVADAVTFTVPWARGTCRDAADLRVEAAGAEAPVAHTWPLAYWPDGSIKWSSHAVVVDPAAPAPAAFRVVPGKPAAPKVAITAAEAPDAITISTGVLKATIRRSGERFLDLERNGTPALTGGRLISLVQNAPTPEGAGAFARESFASDVRAVTVEQAGPVRAVVKIEGTHRSASGRDLLPFIVRLYLHAGSDRVRVMHTFIYDADESKDFLAGLGFRFDVPLRGETYDRHIRFVGDGKGLFAEAVKGITGLRRDPGKAVRDAQIAGLATPELSTWATTVSGRLQYVPAWGDYTLVQASADGFQIRKRTSPGHGWIHAAAGTRAAGVGFVGSPQGGVAFGVRDFWQKHPGQIDLRNAASDTSEVTLWLYSPEAPAMDLRFYHDGMGQDTYPKQRSALEITYEDYEAGYGSPFGIARTSELHLWVAAATPSRDALVAFADAVRLPPVLVCTPQRYLDAGVFGAIWTLPDRSTPMSANLEDHLAQQLDQYVKEVAQHRWYGFWDYGDVMHTYDNDRHVWRYDIGGFAWANSELSPDLWLWYSFCRTGRADIFRLAEAMTRHTGEVDVYHIGRFRYLGTRHGVQHYSCSSKQTRISNASYRRHYFFLTADDRTGDLLRDQLKEQETARKIVVGRKIAPDAPVLPLPPVENPPPGGKTEVGPMELFTLLAAWITEAERTNDPAWHARILKTMQTLPDIPNGFFNGNWTFNLDTGECVATGPASPINVSHLSAVFGMPEVGAELHATYGDVAPRFAEVLAQYGRLYNAPAAEKQRELGQTFRTGGLIDHHARLIAFAAWLKKDAQGRPDPALAQRAWRDFFGGAPRTTELRQPQRIQSPDVLSPIDELPLSTNGASQWGLTTIQMLHYLGSP